MQDISDPVVAEIVKARVKLLFAQPFFGQLSLSLESKEATKWCKTITTDGRNLYWNREFVKSKTPSELIFIICHVVLHCAYDHMGRREGRDLKIWEMANDYIVNYTLMNEKNVGTMPEGGLYDPKYTDEMSSEELYEILKKNSATMKIPFDEHMDIEPSDGEDEGKGKGGGGSAEVTIMGDSDGPPKLTKEDIEQIRQQMRSYIINAAQTCDAGSVPLGIRRMIDELTNPKLDWRTLLDAQIRSAVKDDYTFRRLSSKTWGTGVILPAQDYLNTIDIAIAIDTSGSMTDETIRDILSEVKGIMETFRDFKLRVWAFDTRVYSYIEFRPDNLDEIDLYMPDGGGGTDFEVNWEYMRENDITPERFVMFTDGYPNGGWGDPDYCDTLFVIHGSETIEAPFGLTAYYDAAKH